MSAKGPTQIGMIWVKADEEGGTAVLDYTILFHDQYTETFSQLVSGVTVESYTATGLTTGVTYTFKVAARNAHGLSLYSDEITKLCHDIPDTPLSVATSISGEDVVVSWAAQPANGSPLTAYKVYIRQLDNAYSQELEHCDSDVNSKIITQHLCALPMLRLTQTPYNLVLGDSIDAKVIAVNQLGETPFSAIGTGAII